MPKFYCDYCDTFLTHESRSVRRTHCSGRHHRDAVRMYYQKWLEEQVQKLVDNTTAAFKSGRGMHLHPPPQQPVGAGRMPHQPPPGYHAPPPPHPSGGMIPPPVGGIGAGSHLHHHPPHPPAFGGGGGPPHGYRGLGPPMQPPGGMPPLGLAGHPRVPMAPPPRGLPPRPMGMPPGMR